MVILAGATPFSVVGFIEGGFVRRTLIFLSMVPVALIFGGCGKNNPTENQTTGAIQGKVTNATGDIAIAGASVTTSPVTSSVSTDTQGNYSITGVTPGQYTVTAAKTGYYPSSVAISVTAGNTAIADIHLNTTPTSFDNTCFIGIYTIAQSNDTSLLRGCLGEDGKIIELIINNDDTMQCSGGVSAAGNFNVSGTVTQLVYTLNAQFTGTLQGDSTYYTGNGTWSGTLDTSQINGTWAVCNIGIIDTSTVPAITTQPQSQTVVTGSSVTFTVTATGSVPLSYQWKKEGTDIYGATGTSYTIPSVGLDDSGTYTVVVSNSKGSVTSNTATLTVVSVIVGTLLNPDGSHAAYAKVLFVPSNYDPRTWLYSGVGIDSTMTDVNGNYTITLNSGTYNVLASGDSGLAYLDSITVTTGSTIHITDTLKAPGSIKGIVRLEENGDPTTVFILFMGTRTFTMPDDTSGSFTNDPMAEGRYWVRILTTTPNYKTLDTMLSVIAGTQNVLQDTIWLQHQ